LARLEKSAAFGGRHVPAKALKSPSAKKEPSQMKKHSVTIGTKKGKVQLGGGR